MTGPPPPRRFDLSPEQTALQEHAAGGIFYRQGYRQGYRQEYRQNYRRDYRQGIRQDIQPFVSIVP